MIKHREGSYLSIGYRIWFAEQRVRHTKITTNIARMQGKIQKILSDS